MRDDITRERKSERIHDAIGSDNRRQTENGDIEQSHLNKRTVVEYPELMIESGPSDLQTLEGVEVGYLAAKHTSRTRL